MRFQGRLCLLYLRSFESNNFPRKRPYLYSWALYHSRAAANMHSYQTSAVTTAAPQAAASRLRDRNHEEQHSIACLSQYDGIRTVPGKG